MPNKDPYEVLGIDRDATLEQAKKSFRLLARKYHPDRNPGDKALEAKFKEAEEAWSELEQILPRAPTPLDIPEGASEEEIEDAYVKWLLNPKNAGPGRPNSSPRKEREEEQIWSTVASERPSAQLMRGDWRKLKVTGSRKRYGLEAINPEQAARLLDSHPNAFLVLKIVQQHAAALCLYDAVLSRARYAHRGRENATATALVIVGADKVDEAACLRALRAPLASVDMAEQNLHLIAPRVTFGGTAIPAKKLALDLWFLKENIRELSAALPARASQPGAGTSIVPQ